MDNRELKYSLQKFTRDIYDPENKSFSESLYDILTGFRLGNESLILSYLYRLDTDSIVIREHIVTEYGSGILTKLDLLKRLNKVSFPETKKQIANLRKQFIGLADDLSLIIIKLAERMIALKFKEKNDSVELYKCAEECLYLYSPIAHRLGVRVIYQAMEDIAFKYLFPDEYRKLYKIIEKRRGILEKKLRNMGSEIMLKLKNNNIKADIQYRVKDCTAYT